MTLPFRFITLFYSLLPLLSPLNKTANAIVINARLVHACENPSAVTPAMGPAQADIIANTKPNAARMINTISRLRIVLLLYFTLFESVIYF